MDSRTRRVSLGDKASNQTKTDSCTRRVSLGDKAPNQTKQFLEDDGSQQIPVPKLANPTVVEEEVSQPKDDLRRTKSLNNNWKQGSDDDGAFLAPKMQTQLSLDAHLQKRLKDMNKGRWQRSQFSHSKRKVMSLDEGESPETFDEEEMSQQHDQGEMQRLTVGGMKRRVSLSKGGQDEGDPDDDWEPFSPAGVREWKVLSRDDLWDPLELGKMWKTILPEEKQWKPFLEDDEPRGEEEEQWHPFPVDEEWDPFELREQIDKYKAQRTPDRASNASMLSEYDEEQTYDVEPTEKTQDDLVPSPGQGTLEPIFSADPQTLKASEQGSADVELQRKPSSSQKEVKSFPKDLSQPVASGESLIVLDEEQASSKCDPGPEADGEQLSDSQKQIDPFPEHLIKPQSFGQNMQQVAGQEDLKVLDLNASSINPGPVEAGLQLSDCQKQVEPFPDHLIRPHPSGKNMQQKVVGQEDLNALSNSDPVENGRKRSSDCQKHVEPFPEHLIKPHPYGRHDKSESFEDEDDLIHTLKSDDGYVSRNPAASGPDLSESDLSSGDTLKSDLSSFLEDAEEELSCIICFELLMDPHTPKNLECAHVCCALCLQDLLQKDPHVECPQCRHVTTVAESNAASLKTNLRLRNLAEIYHKHSQGASSDQNLGQCSEHGDRLRYYCQTCNAVVCGTCVCDNHNKSTHDVRDLQDVYAEQTSEMSVVIEMTSKRSQENSSSLSNLKAAMVGFQNLLVLEEDSIDKETQQMIAKIQKAADAKKAVIRKGRQAQLEAMDKKKHKLEMHQGEIQRAIVKARHEVERNQEWDYVTRHHKMVADITALLGQFKHFGHT